MNSKFVLVLAVAVLIAVLSAHSRPSPAAKPDLSKVNFALECTTSSDPSNRLRFAHEEVVNSFLDVPRKFGRERMIVMHLGNDHLASHGGITEKPGQWSEEGHLYQLQNDWGMIGDIAEDSPKVYFLNVTSLLGGKSKPLVIGKDGKETTETKPSERIVDPFETYAISLLKKGEALVRWEHEGSMRAVGAIRSTAACTRCHETKDGDLLGAFTYDFAKTAAPQPTEQQTLALKYAQDGKNLEDITKALRVHDKIAKSDHHYNSWQTRLWLLDRGFVTEEMVKDQDVRREYLLKWVQASFNRPAANKAQAKN